MGSKRKVVKIDDEKCNGCGLCVPKCAEGALRIINGKARLVSDSYCDGLGACLGECPQGAITIEEREAKAFDEEAVKRHIKADGKEDKPLQPTESFHGCPGTQVLSLDADKNSNDSIYTHAEIPSGLTTWPIQIRLVPSFAPFLQGARLLIAADCVAFAASSLHQTYLPGKVLLIGCPKLDNVPYYHQKLSELFKENKIVSIDIMYMEVPCCSGLIGLVRNAMIESGKQLPLKLIKVGIRGKILEEKLLPCP